jgi:hypothetical protein
MGYLVLRLYTLLQGLQGAGRRPQQLPLEVSLPAVHFVGRFHRCHRYHLRLRLHRLPQGSVGHPKLRAFVLSLCFLPVFPLRPFLLFSLFSPPAAFYSLVCSPPLSAARTDPLPRLQIASYIGIILFIVPFVLWKIFAQSKFVRARDMDLWSGVRLLPFPDTSRTFPDSQLAFYSASTPLPFPSPRFLPQLGASSLIGSSVCHLLHRLTSPGRPDDLPCAETAIVFVFSSS